MDKSKASLTLEKIVFLYLLLFPFGQLLAIKLSFLGTNIRIHPADIVVLLTLPVLTFRKTRLPDFFKSVSSFLLLGVFGLILAISRFGASQAAVGALYLLRAASYLALFMSVYELVRIKKNYKVTLFKALLVVSLEVGFLGFVQYLLIPDLRFLYAFGWDDHLFRLVGTFLDPGFTGIILAFGSILALAAYLKEKKSIYLLSLVFLTLTLLLTYSRASFLAFGVGLATLFLKTKKGLILLMALLFALAIPFLPRPQGYGVRLERTHSIVSRLTNYSETFEIFKKSPVFGIGYNNMCLARQEFLGDKKVDSHACSGADSSVLLILATSGIVGLILVLRFVKDLLNALSVNYYSFAYLACLLALLVHSQFVNSLVYPWVMGYLAILGGISVFGSKGRS